MKFYNRENELAKLERIVREGEERIHLVVSSGRRRVGKTELIRHFAAGKERFVYLFVSKKKSNLLLEEFRELLSEHIPLLKSVTIDSFDAFFSVLFTKMTETPLYVVIDEFQNFKQVDESVFSIIQKHWDLNNMNAKGAIICIGSVQTLMRDIFEAQKEPLFGRVTERIPVRPLSVDVVASILRDNGADVLKDLLFFHALFGGIPKYYDLIHRSKLFKSSHKHVILRLFCEHDALLQNEGKELLIEEFGKNYQYYFSILQTVACGVTQMSQIADKSGIMVTSISKYLDELVTKYEVLERRQPVTVTTEDNKNGRYYLRDPLLRFWFRYLHKNQSLVALGAEERLADKILSDLPTFMGLHFEVMIRELIVSRNDGSVIPFIFDRIGSYWDRKGSVEVDVVALDDAGSSIFFGECKLNGNQFHADDAIKLKQKAAKIRCGNESRKEYFALISRDPVGPRTRNVLQKEGISCIELSGLFAQISELSEEESLGLDGDTEENQP